MADEIVQLLDIGSVGGERVLLDGHGQQLAPGCEPVFLSFAEEEATTACNSMGVPFNPPYAGKEIARLRAVLTDIEELCIHSKGSRIWKKVREGLDGQV